MTLVPIKLYVIGKTSKNTKFIGDALFHIQILSDILYDIYSLVLDPFKYYVHKLHCLMVLKTYTNCPQPPPPPMKNNAILYAGLRLVFYLSLQCFASILGK